MTVSNVARRCVGHLVPCIAGDARRRVHERGVVADHLVAMSLEDLQGTRSGVVRSIGQQDE